MSESRPGRLKGCAIGCGVVALVGFGLLVLQGLTMMRPFRQAIEARAALEERFGTQDSFAPPASGAIAAERMMAFLEVRHSLAVTCRELEATSEQMRRLDSLDDDAPRIEIMREAWKTSRSAFGIAGSMGDFFEIRNRALLDAEMGLGEYTYVYVLAYQGQLARAAVEDQLLDSPAVNGRVREALQAMLVRQREALMEDPASSEAVAALDAELEAMAADVGRLPWQGGLPPVVAASIAPYRDELDDTFCEALMALDLATNRQRGLSIETE